MDSELKECAHSGQEGLNSILATDHRTDVWSGGVIFGHDLPHWSSESRVWANFQECHILDIFEDTFHGRFEENR
ncbi:hypothetical protein I7I48_00620 [Histoplasma ohiense]|nr:hypothetical protein I7I48_00620 [Histoplasma ohiense (nom. inval.)]